MMFLAFNRHLNLHLHQTVIHMLLVVDLVVVVEDSEVVVEDSEVEEAKELLHVRFNTTNMLKERPLIFLMLHFHL